MKICCLGDIHYAGSISWLNSLVDSIIDACAGTDVAVIVGDITSNGSLDCLHEFLSLLKGALPVRHVLVIPGNHDIYVMPEEVEEGIDSLKKLQLFNNLVENLGCIPLMKRPFILSNVGFIGNIGWYDYSFAPSI